MKNKLLILQLSFVLLLSLVIQSRPSLAEEPEEEPGATALFEQTGQKIYTEGAVTGGLESYAALIVNSVLTLVGTLFLLMTIYGGFLWMEARGDETKATKARDIIVMAAIGLAVVIGSYALSVFILQRLIG